MDYKKFFFTLLIGFSLLAGTAYAVTFQIEQGGTERSYFSPNALISGNGVGPLVSTSSPTVGYITGTSTATSTFTGGITAGGLASSNGLTISGGNLHFAGDSFDELVGTGLQVSGGDLQTTLGTSISDAEVDDDITLTNITQITNRAITDLTTTAASSTWFGSNGSSIVALNAPSFAHLRTTTATSSIVGLNLTSGGLTIGTLDCSGLGNSGKLTTNSSGAVICGADVSGAGGGASDFTFTANAFGVIEAATTTPLFVNSTATSTFTGAIAAGTGRWIISTSTTVCFSPTQCHYQMSRTSTSTQTVINQAILDQSLAGGGIVNLKFENATATIDEPIQLRSNVTLRGEGIGITNIEADIGYAPSTLNYGGGFSMVIDAGQDSGDNVAGGVQNVTIEGITFDANGDSSGLDVSVSIHRAIYIRNSSNIRFQDNEVRNTINYAMDFDQNSWFWIQRNKIVTGWQDKTLLDRQDGIHTADSHDYWVTDNYVSTTNAADTQSPPLSGDDAIGVQNFSPGFPVYNIHVEGNTVDGSYSRGIQVIGTDEELRNIVIANNIVRDTASTGILFYMVAGSGEFSQFKGVKIIGNQLYNTGNSDGEAESSGIALESDPDAGRVMYEDLTIQGNTIVGVYKADGFGIDVSGKTIGLNISDNRIASTTGLAGIRVGKSANPVKDCTVSDNNIDVSDGSSGLDGIQLFGTERCIISGNLVQGHQTGTTYGIHLYAAATAGNDAQGVPKAETSAYNQIYGNEIYNFDNGILERDSTTDPNNNYIHDNQFNTVTTPLTVVGGDTKIFEPLVPNATSTIMGGLSVSTISATSTTATSTFAGGIAISGGGLKVSTFTSCTALETDANGNVLCGSDATGSGVGIGDTVTSGTSGSILFVDGSGNLAQDNANFFFDNTADIFRTLNASSTALSSLTTLTVGSTATTTIAGDTASSTFAGGIRINGELQTRGITYLKGVSGSAVLAEQLRFSRADSDIRFHSIYSFHNSGAANNYIQFRVHDSVSTVSQATVMSLFGNGRVGIGTTTPGSILSVQSVGNFAAASSTLYSSLLAPDIIATSTFTLPFASSLIIDKQGMLGLDTDGGGQLVSATSTGATPVVFAGAVKALWGATIPNPATASSTIGLPTKPYPITATHIMCSVFGGTNVVIDLIDSAGNNTNDITCTETSTTTEQALTTNNTFTRGEGGSVRIISTSGNPGQINFSVVGTQTPI